MVKENKQKQQQKANNPFPKMEQEVLNFWKKADTFKKSVEKKAPKGNYVFYDGPPFGTGEPHYGHLLSSISKDVMPRYWTMQGYRVERRWGWDCHGLPIENIIEADMGISGKKEIEKIGVAKFNEACRSRVLEYADIWGKMIRRIARWVEFENSYKTMDLDYMESIWWAFKELWHKDLIYQGRKVLLYCPRCETPISNFEVAMDNSYQEITEPSVYVKFKVTNASQLKANLANNNVYILAWTTTPWTLPGNVALAVGKNITYTMIKINDEYFILAKDCLEVIKQKYETVKEFKGKELIDLDYEPLFDVPALRESGKKVYFVADADFVTTEDGTGVVHTAVVYGEDDYNLGLKLDLPVIPVLDDKGYFNETVSQFKGIYFKDADKKIIEYLDKRGLLLAKEDYKHPYPFCHRCNTQLFYNAIPAWFLNIEKIRKKMLEQNEKINWFPKHLKHGRFAQGIEQAPDWNISRNRYFATPMPIWQCDGKGKKSARILALTGPCGAGKTTIANIFKDKKDFIVINGDKVREELFGDIKIITTRDLKKILQVNKEIIKRVKKDNQEGKNVVIDYVGISFNPKEYQKEFGDDFEVKVLMPRKDILVKRDKNRQCWANGKEFAEKDWNWFNTLRKVHGEENYIDNSPETVQETFNNHFKKFTENYKKCQQREIIGSVKELEKKSGKKNVKDIHCHFINDLTWKCTECSGVMRRISEVFDCWVESGSMSFAQMHYPFENKEKFEKNFPAQFISEYISQTRAWFYVMHVLSTALFDSNSFENVVTTGVIFNEKGEKLSKSKENFPDPWKVINEFGADALRFYLMSSSLMQAENLFFNERELRDVFRKNVILTWNVYAFYKMHAFSHKVKEEKPSSNNVLDKWIIARLNQLIEEVTKNMNNYNLPKATRPITDFINDFSTWYLRRSRDRFKTGTEQDKQAALQTTGYVLLQLSKTMAPFMPFIAEQLWQRVVGNNFKDEDKSVHLEKWPEAKELSLKEKDIIRNMDTAQKIIELALAARNEAGIKVRQPLQKLEVTCPPARQGSKKLEDDYVKLIKDEVNIKEVEFKKGKGELKVKLVTKLTPELKQEGIKREIVRFINAMRKQAKMTIKDNIHIYWKTDDKDTKKAIKDNAAAIKTDTLASKMDEEKSSEVDLSKEVEVNGAQVWLGIKKK